jgi:hypothetical protein
LCKRLNSHVQPTRRRLRLDPVAGVRIEYRAPRREDGLGGGWFGSCSFAGRAWRFRFYGRDWKFGDEDASAWKALTPEQRGYLRVAMLAALDRAQRGWVPRRERQRQVRSALRLQAFFALRDKQQEPARELPAAPRPRPGARRPRQTRTKARTVGARGDPSPSSLVADLAARLPRERGGAAWRLFCPQCWAAVDSQAEALSLVDEHMRGAHPDEVPR